MAVEKVKKALSRFSETLRRVRKEQKEIIQADKESHEESQIEAIRKRIAEL